MKLEANIAADMKCTVWILTLFYIFLLEIPLFLIFKSTLKVATANRIGIISKAISFGAINYFSLFGEQMGLSYAELIQSRDWKREKCKF